MTLMLIEDGLSEEEQLAQTHQSYREVQLVRRNHSAGR